MSDDLEQRIERLEGSHTAAATRLITEAGRRAGLIDATDAVRYVDTSSISSSADADAAVQQLAAARPNLTRAHVTAERLRATGRSDEEITRQIHGQQLLNLIDNLPGRHRGT